MSLHVRTKHMFDCVYDVPLYVCVQLVELGAAQARLAEAEEEAAGLREGLADRERRIKELQLELLSSSQSMAADANSHGQQMREEQEQLNKCKVLCAYTSMWHMYMYSTMSCMQGNACGTG